MKVITFGRHPNNDVVIKNCIVEKKSCENYSI